MSRNTYTLNAFATYTEAHRWPTVEALTNNHFRGYLASLNEISPHTHKPLSSSRKNKVGSVVRTFAKWLNDADPLW